MSPDIWLNDELYVYDCTMPDDPKLVPAEVKDIVYGKDGNVHAAYSLPMGYGLYSTPDVGAIIEIVRVPCGPPDIYENATPVIRITHATATKWTDVPSVLNEGRMFLEMNVLWEGVVELLETDAERLDG